MSYYLAGDYYRAGGGRNYAAGGLFSFLGKAAKSVGSFIGGPIGAGLQLAGGALAPATPTSSTPMPPPPNFSMAGGARIPSPTAAARGVTAVGVSPLGTVGIKFKGSRRMNAGNAKAARRAIRRIKSVRHLLQSIERELPRRPAPRGGGSRGVITRAEASRALRR